MLRTSRTGLALAWLLLAAGCASLPATQQPAAPAVAKAWSAPLPHAGNTAQLVDWWKQFNDPALTALLEKAEAGSPSLASAWASIAAARANLAGSEAGQWPQVNATGSLSRSRGAAGTSGTTTTTAAGLDASWEIDLFGKLRHEKAAARAKVQARVEDWHEARVSLAAEVADTYVQYRACELVARAYREENDSQQETARLNRIAVEAGFTAPADGALADAGAASTHAQMVAKQADCEVLVKSLVALVGGEEAELRRTLQAGSTALPTPAGFDIASVPADLLRQRPDLASRERELAAAIASVDSAEADRYPSLSLTGSISRSRTSPGISLTPWSFGPSLSLPLFDGGRRRAAVRSAEATRDAALASYQQAVRNAVKEVEQALVRLDSAAHRSQDAVVAADGYRRYFKATDLGWKAGSNSLLAREEARRTALNADINRITLQLEQVQQWIALYKALGGGWSSASAATAPASVSQGETK